MLPLPFLPTPSRLATQALNMLLKREDWARERLVRHAGKTVRFALGGFSLGLTIGSDGLAELSDPAVVPDVTLTVSPEKLPLPLPRLSGGEAPDMAEATHISGDAALAQVVADLSKQLRWDPEDALARVVGDIAALRLVGGARRLAGGTLQAGQRAAENVSEYRRGKRPAAGPSGAGAMAPGPGRAGRARRGAGAVRRRSADETGRRRRKRGA